MTTVPTRQSYDGPALFANGFRPFFLLGSIYAGLAILVWLPVVPWRDHPDLGLRAARLACA